MEKKRILIIEDEEKTFNKHKKTFTLLGYDVYPKTYALFHKNKQKDILSLNDFFCKMTAYITNNHIDILSLDLQLKHFEYDFFDDSNVANDSLGGIKLIEKISKSTFHHLRTLPIIIISKFNKGDIEKINNDSKYVIAFINKKNIDNEDNNEDENILGTYLNSSSIDERIDLEIEKYHRFVFLEFLSTYGDKELYFNKVEEKVKEREVTKEYMKQKKEVLINALNEKYDTKVYPHYQAIYNQKNEIEKYEALARVRINDRDESFFIYNDIAKFYGLISKVTFKIIDESFKCINGTGKEISINICYEDLKETNFENLKNYIDEKIKINKLKKEQVTLEILEGVNQNINIVDSIVKLKRSGFKIAIDDFGIENSNFLRLKKLLDVKCIDFIKIDGEFIKDIDVSTSSKSIVSSIKSFVVDYNENNENNENNLKIVAEFVCKKEVLETCLAMGIDLLQGFHLKEPCALIDN